MRFCLLETSCEQDDCFPPGICVKVNGKMCPLPVSKEYWCYKGQDVDDTVVLLCYIHMQMCYTLQLICSKPLPSDGDMHIARVGRRSPGGL
jgi:hypothetical protein